MTRREEVKFWGAAGRRREDRERKSNCFAAKYMYEIALVTSFYNNTPDTDRANEVCNKSIKAYEFTVSLT
jgi:hypothetical protein